MVNRVEIDGIERCSRQRFTPRHDSLPVLMLLRFIAACHALTADTPYASAICFCHMLARRRKMPYALMMRVY